MPGTMTIPDRKDANIKEVEIEVSTGEGDKEKTGTFLASLPATLADAIAVLGEQDVFRRFINAYVVYLQGKERNKLNKDTKPRVRASYLESLGI